jgi:hypothetical protein
MNSNLITLTFLILSISSIYSEIKIHLNKNETDLSKANLTLLKNENILIAAKEEVITTRAPPKYLNKIKNKLHDEMVKKCDYGNDPMLVDICPSIKDDNRLILNELDNLTLSNIEHLIIDYNIVKKLKEKCALGEWCLDGPILKEKNTQELKKQSSHNLEVLRLYSECYSNIADYIDRCTASEISKSVLNMGKVFHEFNPNIYPNKYCPEHTLRIIHVYVATMINHKPNSLPEVNVCINFFIFLCFFCAKKSFCISK